MQVKRQKFYSFIIKSPYTAVYRRYTAYILSVYLGKIFLLFLAEDLKGRTKCLKL